MRTHTIRKVQDANMSIGNGIAGHLLTKQQTIDTTVLKATLTRGTLG
jgi:hypothetical protein